MSLVAVRDELAKRLGALDGLRVYSVPPDTVPQLPAAVIQPGQPLAEYGRTLSGGDVTYTFTVLLLTQSGDDEQAWQDLAAYVAPPAAAPSRPPWKLPPVPTPAPPTGSASSAPPKAATSRTGKTPIGAPPSTSRPALEGNRRVRTGDVFRSP